VPGPLEGPAGRGEHEGEHRQATRCRWRGQCHGLDHPHRHRRAEREFLRARDLPGQGFQCAVLGVELLDERTCPIQRQRHLLDLIAQAQEVRLERDLLGACRLQVPLIAAYHHRRRLGDRGALPRRLRVQLAHRRMIVAVAQPEGRPRRLESQEPRIQ
jgi:hypothetical protein